MAGNGQALTPRFGGDNAGLGGVVLSGGSKVTWLKTHNMAHTILVRLDVDDEYADIPPDITAMDYLEGSKAHGWEVVTERVFTESEVMAIVERIGRANVLPEALYSWSVHVAKEAGVSFDPA